MEYNKKLEEIEKIMLSIEDEENNDIDKQMELYEKGKKKCIFLEKKINLQKNKIENIDKDIEVKDENRNKDIKEILTEIEEIYKKINSEDLPADKIEEFLKKSLILKKQSEKFNRIKDLEIKYI
jgi:exonuclease VII small subunit